MSDHELEIVSCIAKTLKASLPSIPMNLATRYAMRILDDLNNNGWITVVGK